MEPFSQKSSSRNSILLVVATSFIVGSLTGGLFGLIGGSLASDRGIAVLQAVFGVSSVSNGTSETLSKIIRVDEDSATTEVVKKVSPAVVSVIGTQDLSKFYREPDFFFPFGDIFDFPFSRQETERPQGKREVVGGTGFIVAKDGMVVTNRHVVSAEGVEYSILTADGKRYDAKVLAKDPLNDIAILKIDAENLLTIELGDSDTIEMGQTVIAIGNVLGRYRSTVTRGVVSGIDRTIVAGGGRSAETLEGVIQTDASINEGNSGGPLLNLAGQVIGVNTAVDREGESIGFSIPINEVRPVIESVQKEGKIVRPILGIRYTLVTPAFKEQNNLSVDYGALVIRGDDREELAVIPGSPADKAGIVENDIVLEINDQKIDPEHSLARRIRKHKVGDRITLKILHDGEEKVVQTVLEEFKKQ